MAVNNRFKEFAEKDMQLYGGQNKVDQYLFRRFLKLLDDQLSELVDYILKAFSGGDGIEIQTNTVADTVVVSAKVDGETIDFNSNKAMAVKVANIVDGETITANNNKATVNVEGIVDGTTTIANNNKVEVKTEGIVDGETIKVNNNKAFVNIDNDTITVSDEGKIQAIGAYRGEVETYNDLPTDAKVGDMYYVKTTSEDKVKGLYVYTNDGWVYTVSKDDVVYTYGEQEIGGHKTFSDTPQVTIDNTNYNVLTELDGQKYVDLTSNQTIEGTKTFTTTPLVNDKEVLVKNTLSSAEMESKISTNTSDISTLKNDKQDKNISISGITATTVEGALAEVNPSGKYVDLTSEQTIGGNKTFSGYTTFKDASPKYSIYVYGTGYFGEGLHSKGAMTSSSTITATAFYATSDERLKEKIGDLDMGKCEDLLNVAPCILYRLKDDPKGKVQIGTTAQALQDCMPELVDEGADGMLTVAYDRLSVVCLALLKKQDTEIALLKGEVESLKEALKDK